MRFNALFLAFLMSLLWACGTDSSDPREFSSSLYLVSPQDSTEVVLEEADNDSLYLIWNEPTDITGTLVYTAILDLDKDFSASDGSVMRIEVETDTSLGFSFDEIASLGMFNTTNVDTVYFTVYVRNSSEEIRSKEINRFTLKVVEN